MVPSSKYSEVVRLNECDGRLTHPGAPLMMAPNGRFAAMLEYISGHRNDICLCSLVGTGIFCPYSFVLDQLVQAYGVWGVWISNTVDNENCGCVDCPALVLELIQHPMKARQLRHDNWHHLYCGRSHDMLILATQVRKIRKYIATLQVVFVHSLPATAMPWFARRSYEGGEGWPEWHSDLVYICCGCCVTRCGLLGVSILLPTAVSLEPIRCSTDVLLTLFMALCPLSTDSLHHLSTLFCRAENPLNRAPLGRGASWPLCSEPYG